jgi:hypothetical protein
MCEQAVRLKLGMRRAPGSYKIEVPSRDSKKWGEHGCDEETKALRTGVWLQVIDHEADPDTVQTREPAFTKPSRDGIAYIPFGPLTKLEESVPGHKTKAVLEKGWVVSMAGDGAKLKRKASSLASETDQPPKRVNPNRGVSPAHLARIKALMGQE